MTTTPLHPLVPVLCDGLLGQPLAAILPPQLLCSLGQKAALLYLGSAQAEAHTQQAWQRVFALLAEGGTLRTRLPAPVVEVLNSLLLRPYLLPRPLLLAVLSRPPLRRMSRELMVGTLLDYSRKVRTQMGEASQTRGGMLGRLASEAVKKSTSALGSIAPGMTAAVSDELERQFRTRISEFADSAVDDLAQRLAAILTDPTRQAEHRELGQSLLDFVLDLPLSTIATELHRLDPQALATELRHALVKWLSRPESEAELLKLAQHLAPELPTQSLQSLLGPATPPLRALLETLLNQALAPQPLAYNA
jgi:hypothetical protein